MIALLIRQLYTHQPIRATLSRVTADSHSQQMSHPAIVGISIKRRRWGVVSTTSRPVPANWRVGEQHLIISNKLGRVFLKIPIGKLHNLNKVATLCKCFDIWRIKGVAYICVGVSGSARGCEMKVV